MDKFLKDNSYLNRETSLRIFDASALSPWSRNEFTTHRNVLVVWDADRDTRILDWIEQQPCEIVDQLVVVSESKGNLWLMWKLFVPDGYSIESHFDNEGDVWTVFESRLS